MTDAVPAVFNRLTAGLTGRIDYCNHAGINTLLITL